MTARTSTSAAGDTSGRPARTGRGEHPRENLLSLNPGAGPTSVEDAMARPVRFDDPERNAAYWERVARISSQAPPLSDDQRARIRAAFHAPATQEAA